MDDKELSDNVGLSFLYTGVIFAFYQALENVASTGDILNKKHRLEKIAFSVYLSSFKGLLSLWLEQEHNCFVF